MGKNLREFQVFAKPVGPVCNLNCTYCYYLGKKQLYPNEEKFRMTDDLLEKYVIQHIQATTDDIITFSWHGGEPLLAGIDFYRKAVSFQGPAGGKTSRNSHFWMIVGAAFLPQRDSLLE